MTPEKLYKLRSVLEKTLVPKHRFHPKPGKVVVKVTV